MTNKFVSVLRKPDASYGATEASPFRFEEKQTQTNDVKYDYTVQNGVARLTVYPSGSPVKYLKLRWNGDMSHVISIYADQWKRGGASFPLEWRSVMAERPLPWFCIAKSDYGYGCYGVKTGPDAFVFWQIDTHGVTLFLNLMSGNRGTDLKAPILACEVCQLFSEQEDSFLVAREFAKSLCDKPVLPKEPVFGVNNWYWAYGVISHQSVREETDYLMQMCSGAKHRPHMIIDDGWQINRTYGEKAYIGGPWVENDRFKDMRLVVDEIHAKGAKAGLWFRPLLTTEIPVEDAFLAPLNTGGLILDPTHEYTLERVAKDTEKLRSWGVDVIKHDFSTFDITGSFILAPHSHDRFCTQDRTFYDNTITTATAIKNLYSTIEKHAGGADVIGCNTIGHLTAGIHSIYRVGGDSSGRSFEWTRRNSINSMMRLPLNESFYLVDPDCAAFTDQVDPDLNLDFLEMCAITGVTTLASVTPGILTDKQMERINKIFLTADDNKLRYTIKNYDRNVQPEIFVSGDGKDEKRYDWTSAYDGARTVLNWLE